MAEIFVPIAFWLMVLFPIGVFVWLFRLVRRSGISKFKGIVRFFSYSVAPALAYTAIFLILIGVEEVGDISVIREGYARTLLPVVGLTTCWVLVLTAVFSIAALMKKPGKDRSN